VFEGQLDRSMNMRRAASDDNAFETPPIGDIVGSEPDVYLPVEVAQKLRMGRATVYDAIARNEIPSIRVGKTVRVPAWWVRAQLGGHS
jgi:excisionase family DNA binding protein